MMKRNYLIYISVLFFGACTPYEYVSQMPVEPMFTEKNQGKINISKGFNHGEIQGAYSLSNHIGISTNQYFGQTKGYTAGLHLYHHIYRNFYTGFQGGFGENKLKYKNLSDINYHLFSADIYYHFKYIEPSLYYVFGPKNNKIGFAYRVIQNNFNKFYFEDYKKDRSNNKSLYSWEIKQPQKIYSQTFLLTYESELRNPKYFIQIQIGKVIFYNKLTVESDYNPFWRSFQNYKQTVTNYNLKHQPIFFNIMFGRKF